jgi:hypothetical protein
MSGGNPFIHTLQQEINDLRAQVNLLPPGRKRNVVLARAGCARSHDESIFLGSSGIAGASA